MTAARQCLILAGSHAWACSQAQQYACRHMLWLGEPPPGIPGGPAREAWKWLGRELDLLIIDTCAGFDVEAFGAATGSLRAGGLLLLLIPELETWPDRTDPEHARIAVYPHTPEQVTGRFLQRLLQVFARHQVPVVQAGDALPCWQPANTVVRPGNWRTDDQQQVLQAILATAQQKKSPPVVLTADRGRGKSAVLGMAARELVLQHGKRILVTAPRRSATDALFSHAGELPDKCIPFYAPDELLQHNPAADVLLIDEAAAIPAPLLEEMLQRYPCCIYATTLHGYEGTGQGFAVRFRRTLDEQAPGWLALQLHEPIRWGHNDPLEALVFDALLLDAQPATQAQLAGLKEHECVLEKLDRSQLWKDEARLRQLFGLLVLAHYRTSPLDLRHLLDGTNVSVWALIWQGQIAGTALAVEEGGFDTALANTIYQGKRRPHGHLIAQSLALHSGFAAAPCLRGERIMRIAIHPALQGRGLGSRLVHAIVADSKARGQDYVGVSFAASTGLLDFWQRQNFYPVRLGLRREASSGSHALIMLHPVSTAGQQLFTALRSRFLAHLPALLSDGMQKLETGLATQLLEKNPPAAQAGLDEQDIRDIHSFIEGWRGYEVCQVALRKLLADRTIDTCLTSGEQQLIEHKIWQRQTWPDVVASFSYRGKAAALQALRQAMRKLWQGSGSRHSGHDE